MHVKRSYLTLDQLCQEYGLKKSWVYSAVHERTIPFTKMRHLLRFDAERIEDWVAENTFEPEPTNGDEN